ncbi:hypothetical protein CF327_g3314 [Tilletia walkeri]|uniref:Uncharacterized protein n=1 Tax=Tilletia walkeri TaxID=117179 RepID=A0A8X7N8F0_9BASI|nr:hypothetical protein CF327_g3314 [Tilletia walkeri]KAE8267909.1 hypothetical protein A4X09_0g4433 [Tilletia walkeri]
MQINTLILTTLSALLITSASAAYTFRCSSNCDADPALTLAQTTYACTQCKGTMTASVCTNVVLECFGYNCKSQGLLGCLGKN